MTTKWADTKIAQIGLQGGAGVLGGFVAGPVEWDQSVEEEASISKEEEPPEAWGDTLYRYAENVGSLTERGKEYYLKNKRNVTGAAYAASAFMSTDVRDPEPGDVDYTTVGYQGTRMLRAADGYAKGMSTAVDAQQVCTHPEELNVDSAAVKHVIAWYEGGYKWLQGVNYPTRELGYLSDTERPHIVRNDRSSVEKKMQEEIKPWLLRIETGCGANCVKVVEGDTTITETTYRVVYLQSITESWRLITNLKGKVLSDTTPKLIYETATLQAKLGTTLASQRVVVLSVDQNILPASYRANPEALHVVVATEDQQPVFECQSCKRRYDTPSNYMTHRLSACEYAPQENKIVTVTLELQRILYNQMEASSLYILDVNRMLSPAYTTKDYGEAAVVVAKTVVDTLMTKVSIEVQLSVMSHRLQNIPKTFSTWMTEAVPPPWLLPPYAVGAVVPFVITGKILKDKLNFYRSFTGKELSTYGVIRTTDALLTYKTSIEKLDDELKTEGGLTEIYKSQAAVHKFMPGLLPTIPKYIPLNINTDMEKITTDGKRYHWGNGILPDAMPIAACCLEIVTKQDTMYTVKVVIYNPETGAPVYNPAVLGKTEFTLQERELEEQLGTPPTAAPPATLAGLASETSAAAHIAKPAIDKILNSKAWQQFNTNGRAFEATMMNMMLAQAFAERVWQTRNLLLDAQLPETITNGGIVSSVMGVNPDYNSARKEISKVAHWLCGHNMLPPGTRKYKSPDIQVEKDAIELTLHREDFLGALAYYGGNDEQPPPEAVLALTIDGTIDSTGACFSRGTEARIWQAHDKLGVRDGDSLPDIHDVLHLSLNPTAAHEHLKSKPIATDSAKMYAHCFQCKRTTKSFVAADVLGDFVAIIDCVYAEATRNGINADTDDAVLLQAQLLCNSVSDREKQVLYSIFYKRFGEKVFEPVKIQPVGTSTSLGDIASSIAGGVQGVVTTISETIVPPFYYCTTTAKNYVNQEYIKAYKPLTNYKNDKTPRDTFNKKIRALSLNARYNYGSIQEFFYVYNKAKKILDVNDAKKESFLETLSSMYADAGAARNFFDKADELTLSDEELKCLQADLKVDILKTNTNALLHYCEYAITRRFAEALNDKSIVEEYYNLLELSVESSNTWRAQVQEITNQFQRLVSNPLSGLTKSSAEPHWLDVDHYAHQFILQTSQIEDCDKDTELKQKIEETFETLLMQGDVFRSDKLAEYVRKMKELSPPGETNCSKAYNTIKELMQKGKTMSDSNLKADEEFLPFYNIFKKNALSNVEKLQNDLNSAFFDTSGGFLNVVAPVALKYAKVKDNAEKCIEQLASLIALDVPYNGNRLIQQHNASGFFHWSVQTPINYLKLVELKSSYFSLLVDATCFYKYNNSQERFQRGLREKIGNNDAYDALNKVEVKGVDSTVLPLFTLDLLGLPNLVDAPSFDATNSLVKLREEHKKFNLACMKHIDSYLVHKRSLQITGVNTISKDALEIFYTFMREKLTETTIKPESIETKGNESNKTKATQIQNKLAEMFTTFKHKHGSKDIETVNSQLKERETKMKEDMKEYVETWGSYFDVGETTWADDVPEYTKFHGVPDTELFLNVLREMVEKPELLEYTPKLPAWNNKEYTTWEMDNDVPKVTDLVSVAQDNNPFEVVEEVVEEKNKQLYLQQTYNHRKSIKLTSNNTFFDGLARHDTGMRMKWKQSASNTEEYTLTYFNREIKVYMGGLPLAIRRNGARDSKDRVNARSTSTISIIGKEQHENEIKYNMINYTAYEGVTDVIPDVNDYVKYQNNWWKVQQRDEIIPRLNDTTTTMKLEGDIVTNWAKYVPKASFDKCCGVIYHLMKNQSESLTSLQTKLKPIVQLSTTEGGVTSEVWASDSIASFKKTDCGLYMARIYQYVHSVVDFVRSAFEQDNTWWQEEIKIRKSYQTATEAMDIAGMAKWIANFEVEDNSPSLTLKEAHTFAMYTFNETPFMIDLRTAWKSRTWGYDSNFVHWSVHRANTTVRDEENAVIDFDIEKDLNQEDPWYFAHHIFDEPVLQHYDCLKSFATENEKTALEGILNWFQSDDKKQEIFKKLKTRAESFLSEHDLFGEDLPPVYEWPDTSSGLFETSPAYKCKKYLYEDVLVGTNYAKTKSANVENMQLRVFECFLKETTWLENPNQMLKDGLMFCISIPRSVYEIYLIEKSNKNAKTIIVFSVTAGVLAGLSIAVGGGVIITAVAVLTSIATLFSAANQDSKQNALDAAQKATDANTRFMNILRGKLTGNESPLADSARITESILKSNLGKTAQTHFFPIEGKVKYTWVAKYTFTLVECSKPDNSAGIIFYDGFSPQKFPIYDKGKCTPYFSNLFPLQKFSNMSLTSPRIDHRYYLNTFAAPQPPDIPLIPGDIVRFNMEPNAFEQLDYEMQFNKFAVDLEKMDLIVVSKPRKNKVDVMQLSNGMLINEVETVQTGALKLRNYDATSGKTSEEQKAENNLVNRLKQELADIIFGNTEDEYKIGTLYCNTDTPTEYGCIITVEPKMIKDKEGGNKAVAGYVTLHLAGPERGTGKAPPYNTELIDTTNTVRLHVQELQNGWVRKSDEDLEKLALSGDELLRVKAQLETWQSTSLLDAVEDIFVREKQDAAVRLATGAVKVSAFCIITQYLPRVFTFFKRTLELASKEAANLLLYALSSLDPLIQYAQQWVAYAKERTKAITQFLAGVTATFSSSVQSISLNPSTTTIVSTVVISAGSWVFSSRILECVREMLNYVGLKDLIPQQVPGKGNSKKRLVLSLAGGLAMTMVSKYLYNEFSKTFFNIVKSGRDMIKYIACEAVKVVTNLMGLGDFEFFGLCPKSSADGTDKTVEEVGAMDMADEMRKSFLHCLKTTGFSNEACRTMAKDMTIDNFGSPWWNGLTALLRFGLTGKLSWWQMLTAMRMMVKGIGMSFSSLMAFIARKALGGGEEWQTLLKLFRTFQGVLEGLYLSAILGTSSMFKYLGFDLSGQLGSGQQFSLVDNLTAEALGRNPAEPKVALLDAAMVYSDVIELCMGGERTTIFRGPMFRTLIAGLFDFCEIRPEEIAHVVLTGPPFLTKKLGSLWKVFGLTMLMFNSLSRGRAGILENLRLLGHKNMPVFFQYIEETFIVLKTTMTALWKKIKDYMDAHAEWMTAAINDSRVYVDRKWKNLIEGTELTPEEHAVAAAELEKEEKLVESSDLGFKLSANQLEADQKSTLIDKTRLDAVRAQLTETTFTTSRNKQKQAELLKRTNTVLEKQWVKVQKLHPAHLIKKEEGLQAMLTSVKTSYGTKIDWLFTAAVQLVDKKAHYGNIFGNEKAIMDWMSGTVYHQMVYKQYGSFFATAGTVGTYDVFREMMICRTLNMFNWLRRNFRDVMDRYVSGTFLRKFAQMLQHAETKLVLSTLASGAGVYVVRKFTDVITTSVAVATNLFAAVEAVTTGGVTTAAIVGGAQTLVGAQITQATQNFVGGTVVGQLTQKYLDRVANELQVEANTLPTRPGLRTTVDTTLAESSEKRQRWCMSYPRAASIAGVPCTLTTATVDLKTKTRPEVLWLSIPTLYEWSIHEKQRLCDMQEQLQLSRMERYLEVVDSDLKEALKLARLAPIVCTRYNCGVDTGIVKEQHNSEQPLRRFIGHNTMATINVPKIVSKIHVYALRIAMQDLYVELVNAYYEKEVPPRWYTSVLVDTKQASEHAQLAWLANTTGHRTLPYICYTHGWYVTQTIIGRHDAYVDLQWNRVQQIAYQGKDQHELYVFAQKVLCQLLITEYLALQDNQAGDLAFNMKQDQLIT